MRLKPEWEQLVFAYEGELTYCRLGHEIRGVPMRCDKERLVDMLVGLYGQVLAQAVAADRGLLRARHRRASAADTAERAAKARALVALAHGSGERLFPKEFFGRSMEAMTELLTSEATRAVKHNLASAAQNLREQVYM